MTLSFEHHIHGDDLHDLMRFLIKRKLKKKGATILDTRVFKDRRCPCEPDVYFQWDEVLREGNTKRHVTRRGVIEVESNPSKESIALKNEQYTFSLAGVKLFIFDLTQLEAGKWRDWKYLDEWIEKRLPL